MGSEVKWPLAPSVASPLNPNEPSGFTNSGSSVREPDKSAVFPGSCLSARKQEVVPKENGNG